MPALGESSSDSYELRECQLKAAFSEEGCGVFAPWVDTKPRRCGAWQSATGQVPCSGTGCVRAGEQLVGGASQCSPATVLRITITSTEHWVAPDGFAGSPEIDEQLADVDDCKASCAATNGCDHFSFQEEKVGMYAGTLARQFHPRLDAAMASPFGFLRMSQRMVELGFVDPANTAQGTADLREALYNQILGLFGTSISMVYVGMEDGRFVGYFSGTSYTERAAGDGLATHLPWSPWEDPEAMNAACAADASVCIPGPDGVSVESACPAPPPPNCASSNVRNYYATSVDLKGLPGNVTRWRLYDPRIRPWYTEDLQRYQLDNDATSGYSSIYSFITTGELGVTATATIVEGGAATGVLALDIGLQDITDLLVELLATEANVTWAYVVERSSGLYVGSTTDPMTMSGERIGPANSTDPAIQESAGLLRPSGWGAGGVCGAASLRYEMSSYLFTEHGLDWVIVVGQLIECPAGYIWQTGRCVQCSPGSVPDTAFRCKLCDTLQGEVKSSDGTECVCPSGTYDSRRKTGSESNQHIFCWQRSKLLLKEPDDHGFTVDWQEDFLNKVSEHDLKAGKRCVACPDCLKCHERHVEVKAGYQYLAHATERDVFACPYAESCPGHDLFRGTEAATDNGTCSGHASGLLCSACGPGYLKSFGDCEACEDVSAMGLLLFLALAFAFGMSHKWIWEKLPITESRRKKISLAAATVARSWPRLMQSFRIFVTNYQITSEISTIMEISWPPMLQSVYDALGHLVNFDFVELLYLGCAVPFLRSFAGKLLLQLLVPICLPTVIYCAYRIQKSRLIAAHNAHAQLVTAHKGDQLETAEDVLNVVGMRLQRAVKVGLLRTQYYGLIFMCIYLLFPGLSTTTFAVFQCRDLSGDSPSSQLAYLEVDYDVMCYDAEGNITTEYFWMFVVGVIYFVLFPFGIPFIFGYGLYRHRYTIGHNPDFIALGWLKPLFVFYKADAYLWEVWYMVEKVVLVGVMGFFSPRSLMLSTANILVTVYMLCCICAKRPSRTEEYNTAAIMSHAVLLMTYLSAGARRHFGGRIDEDNQKLQTWFLLFIQLFMAVYLIYISTVKLWVFGKEKRDEILSEQHLHSRATAGRSEKSGADTKEEDQKHHEEALDLKHRMAELSMQIKETWMADAPVEVVSKVMDTAVDSGEFIVESGTRGCNLCLVIHGSADVLTSVTQPPIATLAPGDVFGGGLEQVDVIVRGRDDPLAHTEMLVLSKRNPEALGKVDEVLSGEHTDLVLGRQGSKFAPALRRLHIHQASSAVLELIDARVALKNELTAKENERAERAKQERQRENAGVDAALRRAYNLFDSEGNGKLSLTELKHVMDDIGERLTDEEYEMMIALADDDGDGELDFEEFKLLWGNSSDIAAFRTSTRAWVGGIPKSLAEAEHPHHELARHLSVFGKPLYCSIWPSPEVVPLGEHRSESLAASADGTTWAKVEFEDVHAVSLAIAARGTVNAVEVDGSELQIQAWSRQREIAVSAELDKLRDYEYTACTLAVRSSRSDLDGRNLRQLFEPLGLCVDANTRTQSVGPTEGGGLPSVDALERSLTEQPNTEGLVTLSDPESAQRALDMPWTDLEVEPVSRQSSVPRAWLQERQQQADKTVEGLRTYHARTTSSLRHVMAVDAAAKAAVKLKMMGARIHSRKGPSNAPGRDGDAGSAEHLHHRAVGRTGRARVQTEMPAARSLKRSLTGALGAFGSGKVKVDDTANA